MTFFWFRVKGQWSLERAYELLMNKHGESTLLLIFQIL